MSKRLGGIIGCKVVGAINYSVVVVATAPLEDHRLQGSGSNYFLCCCCNGSIGGPTITSAGTNRFIRKIKVDGRAQQMNTQDDVWSHIIW